MDDDFGADPVDEFSQPVASQATLLGELFHLPLRARPVNPNRSLGVLWDDRCPLVKGFDNCYSYLVRFNIVGAVAGNHYHRQKDEIFHAVTGAFRIVLENQDSKEREEVIIDSSDNTFLYVPRTIVHAVQSIKDSSVLVTLASHPNVDSDAFRYHLIDSVKIPDNQLSTVGNR